MNDVKDLAVLLSCGLLPVEDPTEQRSLPSVTCSDQLQSMKGNIKCQISVQSPKFQGRDPTDLRLFLKVTC